MGKNKFGKFLRHFFGITALHFFGLVANILPLKALHRISRLLARILYTFAKRQRKNAEEGLSIAFGTSLNLASKREITLACFEEVVKGALELFVLLPRRELLKNTISIRGMENLERVLARGNGVICVSAHFGNFPLLMARIHLQGILAAVILRPMRDEKLDRLFLKRRQSFGVESIYSKPPKACVDNTLAFLKRNGTVFFEIDQNFGSGRGVFVDFFGKQAATATGPVVLALRSKAAIIPAFMIRKEDNTQEVVIEPEFVIEKQDDYEETVRHNIARITKIIESYVRRYPAQWSWIHKRWKSRPSR